MHSENAMLWIIYSYTLPLFFRLMNSQQGKLSVHAVNTIL